ncbi:hypothetical protein [Actinomadura madurae]|uniref:hypothetical protein n=1 Tax=Actinomadura madurae TaxID=1993 RepID=UPI0020D24FBA|nr:hypothetical protein [Actinomadura madurae]MCP9949247.1 hypothetical protein [Actinomadura madurae]MCP9966001.1 hypothetical protein [Actinomadura madurae]MCP9978486.1 hypothetical protein [Actinomadura madurae]MCQ0009984.1 hypothetical protein [Actinomadura madurae]MCQ0014690.1 hypothetical protein [Actinomadura madurae]
MQELTAGQLRRGATDPLIPVAALALLAVSAAALDATVLCWASVGALAGFSLSGSV